jgi:hypothetical protein
MANDSWSQMINFQYGPDGSVYAIDWYDKNQCHSTNPEIHQKSLGRIYRISHDGDAAVRVDLAKLSSERLVELQLNRNDWYVQHARRLLQERGPDPKVHAQLKAMLREAPDVPRKLRALWALHVTKGLTEPDLLELVGHESEYVRSWAVDLLVQDGPPTDDAIRRFTRLAREDNSALVRLYLASALQRTPPAKRWDVLAGLLGHGEDATDQNLPLMVWYAMEPVVETDMPRALAATADTQLPRLFAFTVQRVAAAGSQDALRALTDRLGRATNAAERRDLVDGINLMVKRP